VIAHLDARARQASPDDEALKAALERDVNKKMRSDRSISGVRVQRKGNSLKVEFRMTHLGYTPDKYSVLNQMNQIRQGFLSRTIFPEYRDIVKGTRNGSSWENEMEIYIDFK
jgi:LPS sulfotransferase NodH